MGRLKAAVSKVIPVLGFLCVTFARGMSLLFKVPSLEPSERFWNLGRMHVSWMSGCFLLYCVVGLAELWALILDEFILVFC